MVLARGTTVNIRLPVMSWNQKGSGFERRGYHHGNLREALLDAALELIAAKGPAGLAIAEAARLAGVSPAALPGEPPESIKTPGIFNRALTFNPVEYI